MLALRLTATVFVFTMAAMVGMLYQIAVFPSLVGEKITDIAVTTCLVIGMVAAVALVLVQLWNN